MSPLNDSVARTKREARSERRRNQTRAEILDTARNVVLSKGLAGFTLSAVADELALTKPALYYYFDSKEALSVRAAASRVGRDGHRGPGCSR